MTWGCKPPFPLEFVPNHFVFRVTDRHFVWKSCGIFHVTSPNMRYYHSNLKQYGLLCARANRIKMYVNTWGIYEGFHHGPEVIFPGVLLFSEDLESNDDCRLWRSLDRLKSTKLILWLSSYLPQVTPKGYKKGFCHWTGLGTVHPLQKNICWKNSPHLKYRLKKPSILLVLNYKRFNHAVVELQ